MSNGASCVNGVWTDKSSRASKENIEALSSTKALAVFHQLQPVTYNYKSDKKESYVGFIAEDVPELVAINSRNGLSSMDMVAVLTKVVQEQDKVLLETRAEAKAKDAEIAVMKAENAAMETKQKVMQKRLTQIESLLTNLALNTSDTDKAKISINLK